MRMKSFLLVLAGLCLAIVSAGCSTATNTTTNTASNRANTNTVTNTTTTTTTTTTTNTAPANSTANAAAASTGDSVGVAECDEYIKKYEACLTSIAAKAPQVAPALRQSFEAQRTAFKSAAAQPQTKAGLATGCKQAMDTAKASTSAYACDW